MKIERALKLLEINNISDETKETIKKRYRKLMIKYHPDSKNGSEEKSKEINIAYTTILSVISNIQKLEKASGNDNRQLIIISINNLINLYKGMDIKYNGRSINRSTLKQYRAYIISDILIVHNGITYSYDSIELINSKDEYIISCDISSDNINSAEDIIIKREGYQRALSISSSSLRLRIPLGYNVILEININKKLRLKDGA